MKNAMYVEKYLSYLANKKYGSRTLERYRMILEDFTNWSSEIGEICEVRREDIEKYILHLKSERNVGARTVAGRIGLIKRYFLFLEKEYVIFCNPSEEIEIPKVEKKLPDVPTASEINQFIQAIDMTLPHGMRDRTMIELLYGSGLRLNELLSMNIFSIDFDNRIIRIMGKGKKERIIPTGENSIKYVKKYIRDIRPKLLKDKESNALWISRRGTPLTDITFKQKVREYRIKSGVEHPITCHSLRRAFATHMLQNGAHPVHLQHMLGHSSLSTLSSYIRLNISEIKAMHNKTKLGR